MSFPIPTLRALAERTAGAFRSNLKGSDARLWPNNIAVSAKVIAGAVREPFFFLDFIRRQMFAATAEGFFLDRHAGELGMARLPASFAEGEVTLSGDNNISVPAGLVLVRADGVEYDTISGGNTALIGAATVRVRARVAGKAGNAVPGTQVTLSAPAERIENIAVVAALGIGSGADAESDARLRERVLFRKRNPPHGGAQHDYVDWAREVPGVTRVFVDPVNAANARTDVGIWFLMDDTYANGIPQAADVAAVTAHIDDGLRRPAGALLAIAAPTARTVNIVIASLSPDNTAVREAVRLELQELFRRAMKVSTLTDPFVLRVSKIWEAISVATGEDSHALTTPAADVDDLEAGEIPVLGSITFTA